MKCRAALVVDGAAVDERHDIFVGQPLEVTPYGHRGDVKSTGEFGHGDFFLLFERRQQGGTPFSCMHADISS
nr:hypothetical protein [uncultured Mitsuokella sp.]